MMEDGLAALAGMKKGFDLVGWIGSRVLFDHLYSETANDNGG